MGWFEILKRIEVVPEESLQDLEEFVLAEEKGYPSILHPLKIVADFDDETDKLRGYTSFRDFGKFFFTGNTYVFDKGKGIYPKLLGFRNKLIDKPKITLLNPIEGTTLERLASGVKKIGGVEIKDYSQVDDIMDESMYGKLNVLPMYRYPPLKEGEEE